MLEVKDLIISYGKARALKGVSLEVGDGEIVALIGNNGAGKTTLLNAISGLLKPEAGEITFESRKITHAASESIVKAGIIHVPEGRQIFPNLTVRENIRMGAFVRKGDLSAEMDRVFALFPRLKERINQPGGTLSGGEQQMLALARGIMARPKLLMLDEPSLGLAPVLVDSIYEAIQEIHRLGTPVLLVEQNAFIALNTANRAYVLETGRIVLAGTCTSLLASAEVQKAYLGG
jgi:branched-chain amino acid transport system ATP-binding protein